MLKPQQNLLYAFPATNLRKLWPKATKEAGCDGLLFHDLRRSAVRNMMQAGVQQAVASGSASIPIHVFNRYDIVDESDLHDAVKKVEEYKGRK